MPDPILGSLGRELLKKGVGLGVGLGTPDVVGDLVMPDKANDIDEVSAIKNYKKSNTQIQSADINKKKVVKST